MFWLCTCESVKKLSVTTTSWVDFFIKALGGGGLVCLAPTNVALECVREGEHQMGRGGGGGGTALDD